MSEKIINKVIRVDKKHILIVSHTRKRIRVVKNCEKPIGNLDKGFFIPGILLSADDSKILYNKSKHLRDILDKKR